MDEGDARLVPALEASRTRAACGLEARDAGPRAHAFSSAQREPDERKRGDGGVRAETRSAQAVGDSPVQARRYAGARERMTRRDRVSQYIGIALLPLRLARRELTWRCGRGELQRQANRLSLYQRCNTGTGSVITRARSTRLSTHAPRFDAGVTSSADPGLAFGRIGGVFAPCVRVSAASRRALTQSASRLVEPHGG